MQSTLQMCPLILTITTYIAIDTSIWTLNLRKTMSLICTSKEESVLNPINEEKLPSALTVIDVMATKME